MNSIHEMLKRYTHFFPQESEDLTPLREQAEKNLNMTERHVLPGHVTAGALVMKEEKILLIFHPFLKKWLQPGGHIDTGEMPWEAAQRELLEETGMMASLHPWHEQKGIPIDIDIHVIPANEKKGEPEHLHYDFRYLFLLNTTVSQEREHDHEFCWKNLQEVEELKHLSKKINPLNFYKEKQISMLKKYPNKIYFGPY